MSRSKLKKKGSRVRTDDEAKLNITPMMDIFTIILVFLLKMYSAQGQLVTPAKGLTLPTSSVTNTAHEALSVKILGDKLLAENIVVLEGAAFNNILKNKSEALIAPLHRVLSRYADEATKSAERFGKVFSGEITIHGDSDVSFAFLKKVMYTCGEAGYPAIRLLVYRES